MKKTVIALGATFLYYGLQAQNQTVPLEAIEKKNAWEDILLYGAIGIVVVVTGLLVIRFFKNTQAKKGTEIPVITKVFPNPSHGPVTIQLAGDVSQLHVLDAKGQMLKAFAIMGDEIHFDLSSWPRGSYTLVAHYGANHSNEVQLILQ